MQYSQLGQDVWVLAHSAKPGVFVDIGAHDGVELSNTYALELAGWTGVCVECNVESYQQLQLNRKCTTLPYACWSKSGEVLKFQCASSPMLSAVCDAGEHEVETVSLNDICAGLGPIDYISLDTEGSELEILSTFDWQYAPRLWSIEHNYKQDAVNALVDIMQSNGYLIRIHHWDLLAVKDVATWG